MRPFLKPEEEVAVEWFPLSRHPSPRLKAGEIVIGMGPGEEWIVHRVIRTDANGHCRLKGDASLCFEDLAIQAVWGRVTAVRRGVHPVLTLPREIQLTWLDRWIAQLSATTLLLPYPFRSLILRVVSLLGWVRRIS